MRFSRKLKRGGTYSYLKRKSYYISPIGYVSPNQLHDQDDTNYKRKNPNARRAMNIQRSVNTRKKWHGIYEI